MATLYIRLTHLGFLLALMEAVLPQLPLFLVVLLLLMRAILILPELSRSLLPQFWACGG